MRKRQLVAEAIRADPACSDRSIAHDLGVSRDLVTRMRREMAAAGETVLGLPVRGRDGLTYQFKTRHVSRAAELDRLHRRLYSVVKVVESEELRGPIGPGRRRSAGYCVAPWRGSSPGWSGSNVRRNDGGETHGTTGGASRSRDLAARVLPLPRPRQMAKGLKALFDWSCT